MARLLLNLLGQLKISVDDEIATAFESDKVRALLVYLAMEADRPHRRGALAGLFWPERPERAALNNLRGALSNLRGAIHDRAASPEFILSTRQTIQFNSESDHWVDAAKFATLSHAEVGTSPSTQSLEEALSLYQGPFLQGFSVKDSIAFEEWVVFKREALGRQVSKAYQSLVTHYEHSGDFERALDHAWRWIELDSLDENAHRHLMRLLAASGQRANALDHYTSLSHILAEELEVEPSEETQRLHQSLLDEEQAFAFSIKPQSEQVAPAPSQLPIQMTPFVGRDGELKQIRKLLENPACRLITLAGPGGIGKTRLALQAAQELTSLFADGVFFVPLESLTSADFLASATATALKFAFYGPENQTTQLLNYLRGKEALLVLDNFEHILEGVDFLTDILEQSPRMKLMVTSRERLNLQGEWILEIGPMDFPDEGIVEGLEEYDALQLFFQCAYRVLPDFSFTKTELLDVVRICRLMQGMPLGIELSAAWLRTLSADQIVEEIEGGLEFLSSSLRDVPERHRSIWAVFDHSWRRLSEDEQSVFRKLSVFRGGFERESASHVAGASLAVLSALVNKSLIKRNDTGRYEIHTLLQQYGRKHRIDAGEYESVRNRHRDYYLSLAEEVSGQMREHLWGTVEAEVMERLEAEGDNLRIALQWAIDRGEAEEGVRLAAALSWYWYIRAEFSEGRRWLEQTLQLEDGGSPENRARAMTSLAEMATMQRDHPRDVELGQEALQACYDGGYLRQAGWVLYHLGLSAMQQSEFDEAAELCARSFATFTEIGYEVGMASLQVYQGIVACYQGEYERAAELIEEGLPLLREVGDQIAVVRGLYGLGLVAYREQDTELATSRFEEGLLIASEISARLEVAQCLEGLAMVACAKGRFQPSCILLGFSEQLRGALGTPLSTAEEIDYERCLSEIRAELSDDQFSDAWDQGQKMSLEDAAAYALGGDTPS